MAKLAVIVLLALAAVASAKPLGLGGAVVSRNSHVSSSHYISPHYGFGYGLGYPGSIVGHSISSHSSHSVVPHYGLGLRGLGLGGLYPGGVGIGYGVLG